VSHAPTNAQPPQFTVAFTPPKGALQHVWNPFEERFNCSWTSQRSSFGSGLGVRAAFDDAETNVLTFAVSECRRTVRFSTEIDMRDANDHRERFAATYFADGEAAAFVRYTTRLRLDARRVFWSDPVRDAVAWIAEANGLKPAEPPPAAYEPLYSSWYVFRQGVTQERMAAELERAAALGMKVAILDDGWQAAKGDWTIDTAKFPDMKALAQKAHALGMRLMLWASLPHATENSQARRTFDGKFLAPEKDCWGLWSLDPRYPDVRAHLVTRLTALLKDCDLDGFKLDFIDVFTAPPVDLAAKRAFEGCDLTSVPEAAERLLAEISAALAAVRPDALVEFRQRYVGPCVRQYGHMLRANDCPGDFKANRMRTLALRVTSQGSAVHADMLMWRPDDPVSEVKRQIANVLFSTVQYSADLAHVPADHAEAVRDAIAFTREHRRTLLFGTLRAHHPELGYSYVEAEGDDERVVAVYAPGCVVPVRRDGKRTYLVNGTAEGRVVVE
ncbi:MAG: alpha-galactosidase, partial [Kiritimatiellae bacterium]|nr:alpha-galactosidase [Kiritimatiellia bacterium]